MIRGTLAALLVLVPTAASAYTVTLGGPAVGERPSTFVEGQMPASTFAEKAQGSDAATGAGGSSFALSGMDSETRLSTERSLTELGARQEGGRIIVNLPADVLFDFDKSDIRADARPVLSQLAGILQNMAEAPVTITGHTDAKGSDDYNQALSERRADAVEAWLEEAGVASPMTTRGEGEASPVAPNQNADGSDNPEGRQQNRRVEFVIGAAP